MFTSPFRMRPRRPSLTRPQVVRGQVHKSACAALTRTVFTLHYLLCKGIAYPNWFPSFPYTNISEPHTNEPKGHLERFHLRAACADFRLASPKALPNLFLRVFRLALTQSGSLSGLESFPSFLSGNLLETRPLLYMCFRCWGLVRGFSAYAWSYAMLYQSLSTEKLAPAYANRHCA